MPWGGRPAPGNPGAPRVTAAVAAGAGAALMLALGAASGPPGQPAAAGAPTAVAASGPVAAAGPVTTTPASSTQPAERQPLVVDVAARGVPEPADCRPSPRADLHPSDALDPQAAELSRGGSPLGALVLGMASLLCGPLGAAAGLPATELELSEPERLYALVTREQSVRPKRYAPDDLAPLPGGFYEAREEVVDHVEALLAAAQDAGHEYLSVTSGFRDHDTQAGTYEDWVRRSGAEHAAQVSARPGHSEHQLGLAVDVTGECGGFECFGESEDGRWVAANAHRFGFIIRYPEGGKEVTGYAFEPWHLRYVGPRAAWAMHLQGERYWESFAPVALDAADAG